MRDWDNWEDAHFEELKGKTLLAIEGGIGSEVMTFFVADGSEYRLKYHEDCCASCSIEDICGDLIDMVHTPILLAEEASSDADFKEPEREHKPDSETWVFYKLSTIKGSVTIRWYGESNGYYSETASFEKRKKAV